MAIDGQDGLFTGTLLKVTGPSSVLHDLSALSFSAWVYWDGTGTFTAQYFFAIPDGSNNERKRLYFAAAGTTPNFRIAYSTTDALAIGNAIGTGAWHHLCARWADGVNSGKPDIFVDGVDDTSTQGAPQGSLQNDGGVLTVMGWDLGGMRFSLNGNMADAAIFDRRLNDGEIAALASGLRSVTLSPVWATSLEGETGTPAVADVGFRDCTGHGNHLDTIIGSPAYARDPALHWPIAPHVVPFGGRTTHNSRPTMNVSPGTKLATMRRAV